jgi:hypothetical protein
MLMWPKQPAGRWLATFYTAGVVLLARGVTADEPVDEPVDEVQPVASRSTATSRATAAV